MISFRPLSIVFTSLLGLAMPVDAQTFNLQLRSQQKSPDKPGEFEQRLHEEQWPAKTTAVIVCDVWDLHHCLNAVRRLEEFAPRLNQVLEEARKRGATIIHSPSDCMESYADHPARRRAVMTPRAEKLPKEIEFWCSRIPSEEQARYPIDQSDGGEDDDPAEHANWSAKLKSLGRNPGMPWKKQSELIAIDADQDYITDRGDEVWSILEQQGIQNVILTGVHCNMCVLGRPFGLRQMARNGKHVVLMRDMTDSMYNPRRWPYVDHFTGNDLVIAHVERFVCPTITSDQVLGGQPFRSKYDSQSQRESTLLYQSGDSPAFHKHWTLLTIPTNWEAASIGKIKDHAGAGWYRCAVRIPKSWLEQDEMHLSVPEMENEIGAWLNGHVLLKEKDPSSKGIRFRIPVDCVASDDANLIVLRITHQSGDGGLHVVPVIAAGDMQLALQDRWQFRLDDNPRHSNMPLPARFGASPDILFEP